GAATPGIIRGAVDARPPHDDGLPRFDRQRCGLALPHYLQRLHADRRHVKAEILSGPTDFHHHGAGLRQAAAARNGRVRALQAFNRQDRATFHHHRLPDTQLTDTPCGIEAILDILPFTPGRPTLRQHPFRRAEVRDKTGLLNHAYALGLKFADDLRQKRVIPEALDTA